MTYDILEALSSNKVHISDARNLSDYHAVVVDSRFGALLSGAVDVEPGKVFSPETKWIMRYSAELKERSAQLASFFRARGTLVVRLVEPSFQVAELVGGMYTSRRTLTVSSHEWFEDWITDGYTRLRDLNVGDLVLSGRGERIDLREPGHAFADYLLHRDGYSARLNPYLDRLPTATILATNRGGEPVAAEIAVVNGSIVLVPPPSDARGEELLKEATLRLVHSRVGVGGDWVLEEEEALRREREELDARQSRERSDANARLEVVLNAKQKVLDEPEVRRAIGYYERASRAGSPQNGLPHLYNLVDMLKDYFRCGDDDLARVIRVKPSAIEAIKRPQNQKRYDIRHATAGSPERLPATEAEQGMRAGAEIVRSFIQIRFEALANETGDNPAKA
jgi:hypothetical protein